MEPIQQARELRHHFSRFAGLTSDELNLLCLMVVDVIIRDKNPFTEADSVHYWQSVKQEFL